MWDAVPAEPWGGVVWFSGRGMKDPRGFRFSAWGKEGDGERKHWTPAI